MKMQLYVVNDANGNLIDCTTPSACDIQYRYIYTPQLHDIINNDVWPGARVDFYINAANTRAFLDINDPPYKSIKIGGKATDFTGLMEATFRA